METLPIQTSLSLTNAKTPREKVEERLHGRVFGTSAVWEGSCFLGGLLVGLVSRSKLVFDRTTHLRIVKTKIKFKSSGRYP